MNLRTKKSGQGNEAASYNEAGQSSSQTCCSPGAFALPYLPIFEFYDYVSERIKGNLNASDSSSGQNHRPDCFTNAD